MRVRLLMVIRLSHVTRGAQPNSFPVVRQSLAGDKPTSLDGAASFEGVDYHLKRPRHTQRQIPRIRGELIADLLKELNVSVAEAARRWRLPVPI
jgi:hypothetical protein